jgi:DNA-binding CsgD family transcriptional regulator
MYSEKYKNYYTTNFAKEKGRCIHSKTFEKNKEKGYHRIYDDISELHYAYHDYKQASTGQNHVEREIVVVDIDDTVSDPNMYARMHLPFMPTRISWNKKNYHCQFQYFLEVPIKKESNEWKQLLQFSRQYGDPQFTGWQCKNSFYSDQYIKGIEITGKKYTVEDFTKYIEPQKTNIKVSSSHSSLCVNYPVDCNNKTTREGIPIEKNKGSRNVDTFMEGGRWLSNNMRATYDELYNQLLIINKKVSKDLGKEDSPLSEITATAKSLIKYRDANTLKFSLGKDANAVSQQIRKQKAAERKIKAIKLFEEGHSKKEIADILKVSYKTIKNDLKGQKTPIQNKKAEPSSLIYV